MASEITEREEPLACLRRRLRYVYPPRLGDLLHPGRQVGRVTERGVVHPQVVPDLPDHHLSRIEAHPYREADPFADAQLVRVTAECVAQMECRVASPLRVVFVRDRGAK